MLDRLNARHSQHSHTRSSTATTTTPLQSFLDRFGESKLAISSSIALHRADFARHGSAPQLKADLDSVSASIADLDRFVAESSYLLPPYEVRSSLRAISDLKESVESLAAELLPRKKFSFRNKPSKKNDDKDKDKSRVKDEPIREPTVVVSPHGPGFRDREGAVMVKDFEGAEEREGDFSLADLDTCEICLRGRFRALYVHRLRNCRVFVGPVLGSVLIEDVRSCVFMVASHQIRIHEARGTDFYLRVRSRPIVEFSDGLRFGPYRMVYHGIREDLRDSDLAEETGNWANVDDFRWLRALQSPNWRLLEEHEQEPTVDVSDMARPPQVT